MSKLANSLTEQFIKYINTEENTKKMRQSIVDPLVEHFKRKLQAFYIVITILLLVLIVTNFLMFVQMISLRKIIFRLNSSLQSSPLSLTT